MAFSKIASGGVDGGVGDSLRPNAKPLWINGNMQVNQRGNVTGKGEGHTNYYACDRYKFNEDGTQDVVLSISQETLTSGNAYTTDGHTRALKYDVTTADTSLASNIYTRITQRFEKSNTTLIKKGTSSAEKLTLAFWVKATKTGTQIVEILDQVNTRHCCASYTISSADTWEHKVLNFPADTTGALGTGNGLGLEVNFVLAAGSNYTSGTLATSWASQTAANIAVGQVNNFDSTSNNFHLTGIQLEIGEFTSSTLPPFQHESYEDNLARCERYYQIISKKEAGSNEDEVLPVDSYSTSEIYGVYTFRKEMRASPSLSSASGTNYFRYYRTNSNVEFNSFSLDKSSPQTCSIYASASANAQGDSGWVRFINNAPDGSVVALTSEL